jgi:hypothetical protein
MAAYYGFNPAWGVVSSEQLWGQCHADVIKSSMAPAAAVDKAFNEAIFARVQLRLIIVAAPTRPRSDAPSDPGVW